VNVRLAQKWLRKQYPELFAFGVYRPLAIGVREQILPRAPLGLKRAIRFALLRHTRHDEYLLAMRKPGAMRHGLDGKPVGPVNREHKEHARLIQTERNQRKRL
jgi:sRNA-binding protein